MNANITIDDVKGEMRKTLSFFGNISFFKVEKKRIPLSVEDTYVVPSIDADVTQFEDNKRKEQYEAII